MHIFFVVIFALFAHALAVLRASRRFLGIAKKAGPIVLTSLVFFVEVLTNHFAWSLYETAKDDDRFSSFSSFDSSRVISGMMLLLATITTTASTTGCLTGAAMREAAVLPVGQVEVMAGANVIGMVQDDVATTVVIPDVSARIGVANHTDIQLRSAGSASVYYQMFGEPTSRSDIDVTVGAGVYVPTLTWLAPSPSSLPLAIPVQAMVDLPVGHDVTVNLGASIFPVFETSLLGNKLDDNGNALPLVKDFKLTPAITAGVTWYLGNLSLQPAISWGMDDPFGLSSTSSNSKAQAVSGTISVGYVFGR